MNEEEHSPQARPAAGVAGCIYIICLKRKTERLARFSCVLCTTSNLCNFPLQGRSVSISYPTIRGNIQANLVLIRPRVQSLIRQMRFW